MKRHDLKVTQPFFDEILKGTKTFELRRNDRNFEVGDEVHLQEYDMLHHYLSGNKVVVEITYVLTNRVGLDDSFCIFSFKNKNVNNIISDLVQKNLSELTNSQIERCKCHQKSYCEVHQGSCDVHAYLMSDGKCTCSIMSVNEALQLKQLSK